MESSFSFASRFYTVDFTFVCYGSRHDFLVNDASVFGSVVCLLLHQNERGFCSLTIPWSWAMIYGVRSRCSISLVEPIMVFIC